MVKVLKGSMVALMMLGVTGHAVETNDIQVKNAKSEKVNLDGYKTYQITKDSGIINNTNKEKISGKMDVNAEIQKIIMSELEKKGKVLVSENPDFLVAYTAGTERGNVENTLDKTPEAAMALVLIDAKTGVVIVKSTVEADAKGLADDEMSKRLQFAIKNMLSSI